MPSTVVPETRASRSSTGPLHMTRKSPGRLHRLVDVQAFSLVHAGLWMPGFCFIAFLAIANRTTFQPASHRIPVTLAQTENFANLAIIYVVSINMLPLMWGPMFHAASAVRRAPAVGGRDEAMRSVKKLGPDAILIIAFAVAIFLLDLQSIWSPITAFVVVLPLLALTRAIRIGIVAREYGRSGEGVIAYVENFTRRMLVAVMIEAFCLTYATVTSFESLWVTAPNGEATTYLPSMNYCVKHLNSVSLPHSLSPRQGLVAGKVLILGLDWSPEAKKFNPSSWPMTADPLLLLRPTLPHTAVVLNRGCIGGGHTSSASIATTADTASSSRGTCCCPRAGKRVPQIRHK